MRIPKIAKNSTRFSTQDKQEEREAWFKIAVKVIRWKEGKPKGLELSSIEKISEAEWGTYCERMLTISVTNGKSKTQEMLRETERVIKTHGGFK